MTTFLLQDSFLLDSSLHTVQNYNVQLLNVSTDNGISTQFINNLTQQAVNYQKTKFNFRNDNESLVDIRIFAAQDTIISFRSYLKISDLLIKVSSIAEIIFGIFSFFISFIYKKKMDVLIMNSLFDIRMNDLETLNGNEIEFNVINEEAKSFTKDKANTAPNHILTCKLFLNLSSETCLRSNSSRIM